MNLKFWKKQTDTSLYDKLDQINSNWITNMSNLGLHDESNPVTTPVKVSGRRMIKRIRQEVMMFFTQVMRGVYEDPEWDFDKVEQALRKETLLRRAVEKYVEQIWKNGFQFVSKNTNAANYIRKRFRQISQVSNVTTNQLMNQIAYSLVAYGNVILSKKRNENASGGNIRTTFDGKTLKPVAGYFIISPTTIMVDKNEYGVVRKWKQRPLRGWKMFKKAPEWVSDDIVFFKDSSVTDSQFFFAMPMINPVIADVKALRETEELALLQAIKFSIPRYHAKVGEKDKPATQPEIDGTASYIDTLPADGVIVTSSRVDISNVASGDQVLDLDPYLEYWWQRILSGLGMSKVGMGDGSTSNRATAQTVTSEMQNTTIKFQQIIKDNFEYHIIRELLLEGGYTDETINEDNMVYLHIPEIDLDNKLKKENHILQLFTGNAITHDELRKELGMDSLPEGQQDKLYSFMITKELGAAKALQAQKAASNSVDNKAQPANQYGKQSVKPKVSKDNEDLM